MASNLNFIFTVFLVIVLNIWNNTQNVISGGLELFIPSLLIALSAGIFEEFLVRGLFLSGFLNLFQNNSFKLLLTSLISSILFGLLHLINLIHNPVNAILQQVLYATILGLIFSILNSIEFALATNYDS